LIVKELLYKKKVTDYFLDSNLKCKLD
jgi:hypothetical protein